MNMKKVGGRIQRARKRMGLSQTELSQKLGMTAKYISNIECGAKTPRLETFVDLANALQTDANTLLSGVLDVSDEIQCDALWKKLQGLPAQKRQKALRLLDFIVEEL